MREFLYHSTIELTSTTGDVLVVDDYQAVIQEGVDAKIKMVNVTARIIDEHFLHNFSTGTEINIYTAPINEEKKHIGRFIIDDNPRQKEGILKTYQFNGTCYLGRTQHQIVNEFYDNWYIHEIIEHLVNRYAPWLSIGFIQKTEFKMSVAFQDRYLYDCLNEIADTYNGLFEVDLEKKFYFQHRNNLRSSIGITNEDYKRGSANFSLSMDKFANRLVVYGGYALSEKDQSEYAKGDGLNTIFSLKYKPRAAKSGQVEVYKNGVSIRSGVLNLHQFEEGYEALINAEEKNIHFEFPLLEEDEIRIVYRYEYPLKTIIENTESIQEYGLYEQIIEFKDITDVISLRERAQQHIEKYGLAPLFVGSLTPFYNDWQCGEIVNIHIPELGINHELQITSKTTTLSPNQCDIQLNFEQRIRTREILKDILLQLSALKRTAEEVRIEKYEAMFDKMSMLEVAKVKTENLFIIEQSLME